MTMLDGLPFLTSIWLLPVALALHEAEEWNILGWQQRNFVNLPAKTNTSIHIILVLVTLFGFLITALAALTKNPATAAFVLLPFAAIGLLNALQHIFYTIYFKQYAPGVITSIGLLIPINGTLTARAVREDLVPFGYAAGLGVLVILGLIQTMRAGNTFIPAFRAISRLGIALSKWLHPS